MTPLHLGPLHPVEQALTLVLAFGPFVVLAIVVWLRRRADAAADPAEAGTEAEVQVEDGTEGGAEGAAAERPQRDR
ncbi:hypothetical protein [Nocardioides dongxiaopingii]|uniref:hypothetical protein n=1 Tax=Nocardioides dongxiaopingii TaxID=2576036 RepID=UPI0010C763D0|nr:hypothetical protein [Nocardioides dongxiaopingii]